MTNIKKQKESRIPDFKSRQEMAEFWDTHDFTDYMDEFKPIKVRVELARMWLMEKLQSIHI